jgi:hypothetical protein
MSTPRLGDLEVRPGEDPRLAALVNPTILESMWVSPKFVVARHPIWEMRAENRQARQTYLGYSKLNQAAWTGQAAVHDYAPHS